jgi:hypothetical protein
MMYRVIKTEISESINRLDDGAWIPADIDNRDYQQYLEWLAEGNEPEIIDISE